MVWRQYCLDMGLTIDSTKTEAVIFHMVMHRQPSDSELTWHVDGKLLPISASFKYLGRIAMSLEIWCLLFKGCCRNGNEAKATSLPQVLSYDEAPV